MHWYTYIFIALAFVALSGAYLNSEQRNGHRLAYSILMLTVWVGAAFLTYSR